jgi:SagB-type dehydrogenase family enzyme
MQARRGAKFRRSPFLVCYWKGGRLIFHNYATAQNIAATPLTCSILHFFDKWRSVPSAQKFFSEYNPSSITTAIALLTSHSLLEQSSGKASQGAMRSWDDWNPAAGFFHFSTKNTSGTAPNAGRAYRSLVHKTKRFPMPEPIKRYTSVKTVALAEPISTGEFAQAVLNRRTWRRFAQRVLPMEHLSTLLGLTWKVQRWERVPGFGRAALKSSPSGGALHPIEAYVLVRNVSGISPGLYHYAADRHRLELLRTFSSQPNRIPTYLAGQTWYRSAAALVIMTAVFTRTQWKYDHPRFYRAVLIEAGHLCQTFCLAATWLRLAPFCSMALADSQIEADLGLDGVTESVLYAAGVGTRPNDSDWSPAPLHRDAPWWPD